MKRMRRDKLLEEQLVRLDALYEYAVMHGEGEFTAIRCVGVKG